MTRKNFLKTAWRLIYPYWLSEEWVAAWALLVVIVGLNLGLVYVSVLLNTWSGSFYNSLQQKDFPAFQSLILEFCVLAGIYIAVAVYRQYLQQLLTIRWREWLTDDFLTTWLSKNRFYSIELFKFGTDNPDQRIAEDLRDLSLNSLKLALGLLSSVTTLISFFLILWNLSGPLSFSLFDHPITIPGYMVWAAFLYALLGSVLTHGIGKKLIGLSFEQQKVEANFRYSLVRTREYSDAIALANGAEIEGVTLRKAFKDIVTNWHGLMRYQKRLTWFTAGYAQAAVIFPLVVAAPRYFSGAIELGILMQIRSAFGNVQDALSWFVDSYIGLTEWKASVDRLIGFCNAAETADAVKQDSARTLIVSENASSLEGTVSISLPNNRMLKENFSFAVHSESSHQSDVVLQGKSGSGKSTFFRVLAGLWPFASGTIALPPRASMMFFPQKPYLPIGTLRSVCLYPQKSIQISDEKLLGLLQELQLSITAEELSTHADWSKVLSVGEQQRIVLIRAVLQAPKWLFLDEATASLDPQSEINVRAFLKKHLPDTTIVEISHRENSADASTAQRMVF